jgi:transposase
MAYTKIMLKLSGEALGDKTSTGIHEQAVQSLADPQCLNLMTMPGIKAQAAIIITLAIGDIGRFPSPRKLASYAGLPDFHL